MQVEEAKKHAKSPKEAVEAIRAITDITPDVAIVLGSGVSALTELVDSQIISFQEIFGVSPTVAGHAGSVSVGKLPQNKNVNVAVFRGRFHVYEGHDWSIVTLPTRVIHAWGVKELIVTNAAGGINPNFNVGDLMLLNGFRDFISEKARQDIVEELKKSPEPCQGELSKRILQTSEKLCAESKEFRAMMQGVYAGFTGPSYETLAEIAVALKLKCDAVGMSTAPELLTAKELGLSASAISVITNVWKEDVAIHGHEEVLEASKAASKRLDMLFLALLASAK